jgi:hypothetical protein
MKLYTGYDSYNTPLQREYSHTPVREDIRTPQIPPRLAEDGEHIRVLHDKPVPDVQSEPAFKKKE